MSSPVYLNGYLYSTSENGNLVCLEAKTGQVKWEQPGFGMRDNDNFGGTILLADGMLLVTNTATNELTMVKAAPDSYQEMGKIKTIGGVKNWTHTALSNGMFLLRNTQILACYDLSVK